RCAAWLRSAGTLTSRLRGDRRDLHSFPTRRSSDLRELGAVVPRAGHRRVLAGGPRPRARAAALPRRPRWVGAGAALAVGGRFRRSEEHTSELQSRENLVCRLLLEKKNR